MELLNAYMHEKQDEARTVSVPGNRMKGDVLMIRLSAGADDWINGYFSQSVRLI